MGQKNNFAMLFILLAGVSFVSVNCQPILTDPSKLLELASEESEPTSSGRPKFTSLDAEEALPPGLNLLSFKGGESIQPGKTYSIDWKMVSAPENTSNDDTDFIVNAELSRDSGGTWEPIQDCTGKLTVLDLESKCDWFVPVEMEEKDSYRLRLIAISALSGSPVAVVGENYSIDRTPPVIAEEYKVAQEGVELTSDQPLTNGVFSLSIKAQDKLSEITDLCYLSCYISDEQNGCSVKPPSVADSCWISANTLNPASSGKAIDLTIPANIRFETGLHAFSLFAKDAAGNISQPLDVVQGHASYIFLSKPRPPVIKDLIARFDSATGKVEGSFYVYDEAEDGALTGNRIGLEEVRIELTSDDVNYRVLNDDLQPANNKSLKLMSYAVPAEFASLPFRLRVFARDAEGFRVTSSSPTINAGGFEVLAGNTDPGFDGSARATTFSFSGGGTTERHDPGSLVVTKKGIVYLKDANLGVVKIDPKTQVAKILLRRTGTYSGEDGPVENAQAKFIFKIALDYNDRLLVLEAGSSGHVVRRLEDDGTLKRIIGGGTEPVTTLDESGTSVAGRDLYFLTNTNSMFTPLPNGDLYLSDLRGGMYVKSKEVRILVFKNEVRSIDGELFKERVFGFQPSGAGFANVSNRFEATRTFDQEGQPLYLRSGPGITFNPITSKVDDLFMRFAYPVVGGAIFYWGRYNPRNGKSIVDNPDFYVRFPNPADGMLATRYAWQDHPYFSSRRGDLYQMNFEKIYKLNPLEKSADGTYWHRILGQYGIGRCEDGTPALECPTDLRDAFIADDGTLYFLDRNLVRFVDSQGNVQTLFGQRKADGNGGKLLNARFADISNLFSYKAGSEDRLVVYDDDEYQLRELSLNLDQVLHVSGNGNQAGVWATGTMVPFSKLQETSGNVSDALGLEYIRDIPASEFPFAPSYWGHPIGISVDPRNGDVYSYLGRPLGGRVGKLNRATDRWEIVMGGGSKDWMSGACDGSAGTQCLRNGYPTRIIGLAYDSNSSGVFSVPQILMGTNIFDHTPPGSHINFISKWLSSADTHLRNFSSALGLALGGGNPAEGTILDGAPNQYFQNFNQTIQNVFVPEEGQMMLGSNGGSLIYKVLIDETTNPQKSASAGRVTHVVSGLPGLRSYNYRFNLLGEMEVITCSADGKLRLHNTVRSEMSRELPLPNGVSCSGRGLVMSADKKYAIFAFTQNYLVGVGRYDLEK